jgi:transcriptional regulator with XRE-family HTH domain
LKADTQEERRLAGFLRHLIDDSGLTMTEVAERVGVSKSTLGERLSGIRIPDAHLVDALVTVIVRDSRLRELRRAEARQLLRAAQHPAPQPAAWTAELAQARAQQIETYERLTRNLEQRVQEELARARAKQHEAEQLQQRLNQLTDEVDRLRARATPCDGDTYPMEAEEEQGSGMSAFAAARPVGDDEQALPKAAAVNDRDNPTLRPTNDELTLNSCPDSTSDTLTVGTDTPEDPHQNTLALDPDTLKTRRDFAPLQDEEEYAAAVARGLEVLIPDLMQRLVNYPNIAERDATEEVRRFEALLPDIMQVLGPDHPLTLEARRNLADWRGKAGDATEAIRELEALLPDMTRVLGPDHPDTAETRRDLASRWDEAGDASAPAAGNAFARWRRGRR